MKGKDNARQSFIAENNKKLQGVSFFYLYLFFYTTKKLIVNWMRLNSKLVISHMPFNGLILQFKWP